MAIHQVNQEKCTGCGTCVNACPMDVFRRDFKQVEVPPCAEECPAHIPMREYMHLVTMGRYEEACELILTKNPLFAITGHVCFHSCESKCARNNVDESVNINAVERYLGELWLSKPAVPANIVYAAKIAVIGSGPAGLAAAYALTRKGYPVTVFEADDQPGGMLRTAIPEYRMPAEILDRQIRHIQDTGTVIRTNTVFGKDITLESLKKEGYAAVLIAAGAQIAKQSDLEGADLEGVYLGLDFIKEVKKDTLACSARSEGACMNGDTAAVGKNVLVIGGGNTAIDCALSAKKSGADEVTIVYRRTKEEMPSSKEEIELAEAEGVVILPNWAPVRIVEENGKASGVEVVFSVPNLNVFGTSRLIYDETRRQILKADTVVLALGEDVDPTVMPEGITRNGDAITVNKYTMETNLEGVFAAGTVSGTASTVTEAIGNAMQAAESIDRYIQKKDVAAGRDAWSKKVKHPPVEGVDPKMRCQTPMLDVKDRIHNFDEIKQTLSEAALDYEASRCMGCGSKSYVAYEMDCQCCEACEWDCPSDALYVSPEKYQRINVTFR